MGTTEPLPGGLSSDYRALRSATQRSLKLRRARRRREARIRNLPGLSTLAKRSLASSGLPNNPITQRISLGSTSITNDGSCFVGAQYRSQIDTPKQRFFATLMQEILDSALTSASINSGRQLLGFLSSGRQEISFKDFLRQSRDDIEPRAREAFSHNTPEYLDNMQMLWRFDEVCRKLLEIEPYDQFADDSRDLLQERLSLIFREQESSSLLDIHLQALISHVGYGIRRLKEENVLFTDLPYEKVSRFLKLDFCDASYEDILDIQSRMFSSQGGLQMATSPVLISHFSHIADAFRSGQLKVAYQKHSLKAGEPEVELSKVFIAYPDNPGFRKVFVIQSSISTHERILQHLDELYSRIMDPDQRDKLVANIAEFIWWSANTMFWINGSASITDLATRYFFAKNEVEAGYYKEAYDFPALFMGLEQYQELYPSLFE